MRSSRRLKLLLLGLALPAGLLAAGVVAAAGPAASLAGSVAALGQSGRAGARHGSAPTATVLRRRHPPRRVVRGEPHVMLIVMENHGYEEIIGNPTAPYMNHLARRYGLATSSYATTHPSLPNYLELVSGSTQGVSSDCTTCVANATQFVDQLDRAHIGWRAYMEAAPTACFTGYAPLFDRHHDPFVYAPHVVADRAECDRVVPFSAFFPALAHGRLPAFVWVTPDVHHDMHTGTVAQGDAWLRAVLTNVLASTWYRDDGAVIVTFDESTGGTDAGCCTGAGGGHIATFVVSARTAPGARMAAPVDGAGILRTIEALYRVPFLGQAADPRSGTLLPLLRLPRARG